MRIQIDSNEASALAGYDFRKLITITGSTDGILNNYNILVTVHRDAGVDTGKDVYLFGNCQADFDDVVFTKSDGSTLEPHFRFGVVNSKIAHYLVQITSIAASPTTTGFYIHFSNSSATDTSVTTHLYYYDDFESETAGQVPDATNWEVSTIDWTVEVGGDGQMLQGKKTTGTWVRSKNTVFQAAQSNVMFLLKQKTVVGVADTGSGNPLTFSGLSHTPSSTADVIFRQNHTTGEFVTDRASPDFWSSFPTSIAGNINTDWYSIVLIYHEDVDMDLVVTNLTTGTTNKSNMTVAQSNVQLGGTPNEIFFQVDDDGSANAGELNIDWLGLSLLTANEPTLSMGTGEISQSVISSFKSVTSLWGGGELSFDYLDQNLDLEATVDALIRGNVGVTNNAGTKSWFQGEMISKSPKRHHHAMTARETIKKFQRFRCKYSPVLKEGDIRYIEGTEAGGVYKVHDIDEAWSGHNSKIFIADQADKTKWRYYPVAQSFVKSDESTIVAPTFGGETSDIGSFKNLYFYNNAIDITSDSDNAANLLGYNDDAVDGAIFIILDFEVYIKNGSALVNDELTLLALISVSSPSPGASTNPRLELYDYVGADWVEVDTLQGEAYNNLGTMEYLDGAAGTLSFSVINPIELKVVVPNASNYLDDQGNNGQNFKQYDLRVKIGVSPGRSSTGLFVHECYVEGVTDASQFIVGGTNSISATAATELTIVPIGSNSDVVLDGVSASDRYKITETITTAVANLWTSSGASNFGTMNFTAENNFGDPIDTTDLYLFDVYARYAEAHDREFWQVGTQFYLEAPTVSSGLVFTRDDIVDYNPGNFAWNVDSINVREDMLIQGITGVRQAVAVSSPAYTTSEVEIVNRSDVGSHIEATSVGTTLAANKHKNAKQSAIITIDVERSDKDYSALELGKTCTFTPSPNIAAVTFVISEITLIQDPVSDFATLFLVKR